MDEVSVFKKEIHLSGIDEFLADALLEGKGKPVRLAIRKKGIRAMYPFSYLCLRET